MSKTVHVSSWKEVIAIIPEPVPEVDSRHGHHIKLIPAGDPGHEEGEEGIFNITMTSWARKRTFCTRGHENIWKEYLQFTPSTRDAAAMLPNLKALTGYASSKRTAMATRAGDAGRGGHSQRESGGARATPACVEGRLVRERSVIVAKSAPRKLGTL